MARMGKDGYSSKGQTQITARTDDELKEEFKRVCDENDESMTDVLNRQMSEYVDAHTAADGGAETAHYPSDSDIAELYHTCLDVAEHGAHGPMIYQRRHAGRIAQQTQQVKKTELDDAMMQLRRTGYAAIGPMPIDISSKAAKRWKCWIIKPASADPDVWKYREGQR